MTCGGLPPTAEAEQVDSLKRKLKNFHEAIGEIFNADKGRKMEKWSNLSEEYQAIRMDDNYQIYEQQLVGGRHQEKQV